MSFIKAEPCHILLISLNSSQENMDNTQQRLQKVCTKIGYTSVVIRQLNDYIPSSDRHSSLLPYAELLFKNEDPHYICRFIKKLSPIRLYVYGNMLRIHSEWSKLMIATEIDIMDDEDDWCAFLENEYVEDEVKWNFGFIFGREWKVSRVSPLNFTHLDENLRFHSALRRAHATFAPRQVEVTAKIFDWHANCIKQGYLQEEPKLTDQAKLFSFIWLDEMLHDTEIQFQHIIEPFQWQFFNNVSSCVSFIETQLRERRYIFLITSGSLGHELFHSGLCLTDQIFASYIYCAQLDPNLDWSRDYAQIRGIYNDSTKLANKIKQDYKELQNSLNICETEWHTASNTTNENEILQNVEDVSSLLPLPITVYNPEQPHLFMAHQRTIDSLLCMPHTSESKAEMLTEFRRIFDDNQEILAEIDEFEDTYHSHAAVQWYTRDSFVCRTINQALRSSNVEAMFKLRYILTDLYAHLKESYRQMHWYLQTSRPEIFYRGQGMSREEFDSFQELRGSIISINTFLSTTASMQIALLYAGKYHENSNLISVVFSIETNPKALIRPYANISPLSMFQDEEETLFAMGSVYRIGNIRPLPDADNVWVIYLQTIHQDDDRFYRISSATS
ncbi:unnamed protein product [Rotaria sordida]|uniref:NAD(P)(+)--arginine ADP-ribosyltransferase n=1 Tax=Rotaria sordida TaxID=392033 RepID=A0A813SRX0_9BILA|nr:unnamed protein product [Rotaria sordida]